MQGYSASLTSGSRFESAWSFCNIVSARSLSRSIDAESRRSYDQNHLWIHLHACGLRYPFGLDRAPDTPAAIDFRKLWPQHGQRSGVGQLSDPDRFALRPVWQLARSLPLTNLPRSYTRYTHQEEDEQALGSPGHHRTRALHFSRQLAHKFRDVHLLRYLP